MREVTGVSKHILFGIGQGKSLDGSLLDGLVIAGSRLVFAHNTGAGFGTSCFFYEVNIAVASVDVVLPCFWGDFSGWRGLEGLEIFNV